MVIVNEETKENGSFSFFKITQMTCFLLKLNMDEIDWKIIEILQENARITFSRLSKKIHLTAPAVSERILKMEEKGIITGYTAKLNLDQLGYQVVCFVDIAIASNREKKFIQFCRSQDEVLECYLVTVKSSFLVKVGAPSIDVLELFLKKVGTFGQTQTQIILEEIFKNKPLGRPFNQNE